MLRLFRIEKHSCPRWRVLAVSDGKILELQHDKELVRTQDASKLDSVLRGYARYGWAEVDTVDGTVGEQLARLLQQLARIESLARLTAPDDVELSVRLSIQHPFYDADQLREVAQYRPLPPMLRRLLDLTSGVYLQISASRDDFEVRAYRSILTGNPRPEDELPEGELVVVYDTGPYFRETQDFSGVTWLRGTEEFRVYSFGTLVGTLSSEAELLDFVPRFFSETIYEGVLGAL